MQGINQDRQIGFAGVARSHEHCQRTQVDFGLDDRPEIFYFKLKRIFARVNRSYPRFSNRANGHYFGHGIHSLRYPYHGFKIGVIRNSRLQWRAPQISENIHPGVDLRLLDHIHQPGYSNFRRLRHFAIPVWLRPREGVATLQAPTLFDLPQFPPGIAEVVVLRPVKRFDERPLPVVGALERHAPEFFIMDQLTLFDPTPIDKKPVKYRKSTSGSFLDNQHLPVHRWFRYSAGFSGSWAEDLIRKEAAEIHNVQILDPFAGCGTTLIAAEQCGVQSWGIDSHPFVSRIIQAKLAYRSSPDNFIKKANEVLSQGKRLNPEYIHLCTNNSKMLHR